MKRGDVWWVDFEPARGGEVKKTRPAVIVSNDTSNKALNRVQVVPLTSSTGRVYPSEALVSIADPKGKTSQSKAMADQIMTISKLRLRQRLGAVSASDMLALELALRLQLGFKA